MGYFLTTMSKLSEEIQAAINRSNAENGSDTPDFILAEYLLGCLAAYDKAVTAREKWYGRGRLTEKSSATQPLPLHICKTCNHRWLSNDRRYCVACNTPYQIPNDHPHLRSKDL